MEFADIVVTRSDNYRIHTFIVICGWAQTMKEFSFLFNICFILRCKLIIAPVMLDINLHFNSTFVEVALSFLNPKI